MSIEYSEKYKKLQMQFRNLKKIFQHYALKYQTECAKTANNAKVVSCIVALFL